MGYKPPTRSRPPPWGGRGGLKLKGTLWRSHNVHYRVDLSYWLRPPLKKFNWGPVRAPVGRIRRNGECTQFTIFWDEVPKPYIRLRYNNRSGRGERRGAGRRGGAGPSRPVPRLNFRFSNCSCDESAEKCVAVRRGRRSCDPLAGLILSLLKKKPRRSAAGGLCARGGRVVAHARRSLFIHSAPAGRSPVKKKGSPECIRLLSL